VAKLLYKKASCKMLVKLTIGVIHLWTHILGGETGQVLCDDITKAFIIKWESGQKCSKLRDVINWRSLIFSKKSQSYKNADIQGNFWRFISTHRLCMVF
jgi:hypothetical protein